MRHVKECFTRQNHKMQEIRVRAIYMTHIFSEDSWNRKDYKSGCNKQSCDYRGTLDTGKANIMLTKLEKAREYSIHENE